MSKKELEKLARLLEEMQPRHKAFELVKKEMQKRGHWKNKPRGRPFTKRG